MSAPEFGFLRLRDVLQIIPVGRSTFLRWVQEGKAPKAVKLSSHIVAWRVEDIKELVNALGKGEKYENKNSDSSGNHDGIGMGRSAEDTQQNAGVDRTAG